MTALIHVFSGTGNSAHAARSMAEKLRAAGRETRIIEVRRGTRPPDTRSLDTRLPDGLLPKKPADLHLFLYPVYGFAVPHLMRAYIRRLPPGRGTMAAAITTTGRYNPRVRDGYEGDALMQAKRMLARRGYDVFLTDVIDYPVSMTNLAPPPRPDAQAEILRQTFAQVDGVAERIIRGERGIRPCHPLNQAWSFLVGQLYTRVGRRMFGKMYSVDGRCDGCGRCAKVCPAGAIRMARAKPRWKWSCECCERCINFCPRSAVQTSIARLVLFSVPVFWNPLAYLFSFGIRSLDVVLHLAAYSAALVILDLLAAALEQVPVISGVFGLSYTTRFRRYLAPGFKPSSRVKLASRSALRRRRPRHDPDRGSATDPRPGSKSIPG